MINGERERKKDYSSTSQVKNIKPGRDELWKELFKTDHVLAADILHRVLHKTIV